MTIGDDEVAVEWGDRGSISRAEEIDKTEKTGGNREKRERVCGGEGIEGRRSAMTTKGGKLGGGDATSGVGEREEEEKKGESSWKVTSVEVT